MKACLIVFAKEPALGKVKTRLEKNYNPSVCLRLYKAFLKDTVDVASHVDCDEKILAYDAAGKSPVFLEKLAKGFCLVQQQGRHLGERMNNAVRFAKSQGAKSVVVIGSDAPLISADLIGRAFKKLDNHDVVLGPSQDGGYYLIGLNRACAQLFRHVSWSTPTVFKETVDIARRLNKKLALLEQIYDVDDATSLKRLIRDLAKKKYQQMAGATRNCIAKTGGQFEPGI